MGLPGGVNVGLCLLPGGVLLLVFHLLTCLELYEGVLIPPLTDF